MSILIGARIITGVSLIVLWQIGGNIIGTFWISKPTDVVVRLIEWLEDGTLVTSLAQTVAEAVSGFAIGSTAGTVVGLVLGRVQFLSKVLDPYINAVYSLPKLALAPLFILWFGIDIKPKIVLAAVTVFFLVFYNTFSGVRDVDTDVVDQIRLMGAKRRHLYRFVIVPSALTWILVGLRVSLPFALIGAVVMEIVASNRGLGYLISGSAAQFDTAGVFAALVVLMIVSTILNEVVLFVERYFLRWKVREG